MLFQLDEDMMEQHGGCWYQSYEVKVGIGVMAAVTATVLLVVGSVLTTQDGEYSQY